VLAERYPKEGSSKLAKEFSVPGWFIRDIAKYRGLHLINRSQVYSDLAMERSNVQHHFFHSWTQEMSYVLGYIWADGALRNNGVGFVCVEDDVEILEFVKKVTKSSGKIYDIAPRKITNGNFCRPGKGFMLYSRKIVERLNELGVFKNKTYLDLSCPDIPDDMFSHFLRGLFDGDGCVSKHSRNGLSVDFTGSHKFIAEIRNRLISRLCVFPCKANVRGNVSSVRWCSKSDVEKIYCFMYNDAEFFLKRKQRKFRYEVKSSV